MVRVAHFFFLPTVPCLAFLAHQRQSFDDHLVASTAATLKGCLGSVLVTVCSNQDLEPSTFKHLQEVIGPIQISLLGSLSTKLTVCLLRGPSNIFKMVNNNFWNTEFYYLFHFVESEPLEKLFYNLWDTHRVFRVFVVFQNTYSVHTFDPVLKIVYRIPISCLRNSNLLNQRLPNWNMTDFYAAYAGLFARRMMESRSFLVDKLTLEAITDRLNMSLKIKNTTDTTVKFGYRSENGSFYGTFKELVTQKANMTAQAHFLKMYNILDTLTYSVYARADKICIAVPKTEHIPRFVESFKSIKATAWLSILFIYVITAILLRYFRSAFHKVNRDLIRKTSLPLTMFGVCLGLPVNYLPRLHFEKLVLSSILLVSLVVVSVMQSTLNAILSTPPSSYKYPNTMDEFNEQKVNVWTSSKDLIDSFNEAGYTGVRFHLKTATEQKKDLNVVIYNEGILEKTAAFLEPKELEFKYVKFQMTEACPVLHNIAYLYPRGSPFEEPINRILSGLVESGVMEKWDLLVYQFPMRTMQLTGRIREVVELKALGTGDLTIPLGLASAGLFLACLIFAFEVVVHNVRKRRKAVNTSRS